MPQQDFVPATPRVISPSPPASEISTTEQQKISRKENEALSSTLENGVSKGDSSVPDQDGERARNRSRKPSGSSSEHRRRKSDTKTLKAMPVLYGHANGHVTLSPHQYGVSRSPSPLGLIPLHQKYKTFIHRHEIPRKLLHVSIGFFTLGLYHHGAHASQITPWLVSTLIPIAAVDYLRHRFQSVNRLYIRCLGALMRETEVSGYNGVIWYLLGVLVVLNFFPKDVGVMGVLLLSWCDTAASTFGRLYGRYTVRLRHGKSLAGTLAAWAVGVITAVCFWGYTLPAAGALSDDPRNGFMFTGTLDLLPGPAKTAVELLGVPGAALKNTVVSGPVALGIMGMWTGIVAAGSELVNFFGWDDNLTIPVLSGIGMWGFLKVFGS